MSLEIPRTLVIVPAWNEERTVGAVVSDLIDEGYEVLVVSDGSTDDTAINARRAGARVVNLPINLGVGGGTSCGIPVRRRSPVRTSRAV